jgi:hypothetical protein
VSATSGEGLARPESSSQAYRYPVPAWFRWVLDFRSPWGLAAGVGCGYLAIAIAFYNAAGVFDGLRFDGVFFWQHPLLSIELAYVLYFAWVPVAIAYLARGAEHDLARAGPVLGLAGAELEQARRDLLEFRGRALGLGVAIGVALALFTLGLVPPSSAFPLPQIVWIVCRELLVDTAIFSIVCWGVVVAVRLSRLARERAAVRLLDKGDFVAFVQNGVRLALLWLVMWSLQVPWIFFLPLDDFVSPDAVPRVTLLFLGGAALTAIAVVLPTLGVRDRLRAAKERELEQVRRAIDEARAGALDQPPTPPEASTSLPGLLAYERRIEEVSEWPVDARSLRRLGLFLLLPVASWVGGALVERLVDASLG